MDGRARESHAQLRGARFVGLAVLVQFPPETSARSTEGEDGDENGAIVEKEAGA
ncbi:hypothetical protein ACWENA_31770 [Streptomyces sp. NPDC004779]